MDAMTDMEAPDEKEGGSESLDAAKDILAAIEKKDATALDLALQRHYETCEAPDSKHDEGYKPEE